MWSLALAVVLVAAPDQEYDVLHFKDGRKLTGFIVSETKDAVKFRVVILGDKGEMSGGMTARFPKSTIETIDRASEKARDRAKARTEAAETHAVDYELALQKLLPAPVRFMGKDALRLRGESFTVVSTCEDRFVREVTFYLDQVYQAYRRTFGIRGEAERKVTVYLLTDFDEYTRFQRIRFGGSIQNPAFYYPKGNLIAAYNLFPVEKEREIRATILKYERQAREYQKEVKRREDEIRRMAIDVRRDIDKEARKAAASVRADPYGNKNKRLREIEQWKSRQKGIVRDKERVLKEELKEYRDKADAYIAKNRKVLAHNCRARLEANKAMFECLFHEGFHAFSRNFLWKHGRQGVPRWLEEGLASYYERSVVEVGELIHGGAHPFFLDLLRKRNGKLLPLEKVVKGDAREFLVAHKDDTDRSNLYYAQSWALGHYLVGNVPQERILAYARATAAGADPVKGFEKLMGAPMRRVEADLDRHLAGLEEK